jgi:potassium-transporting ATPase KdpC subunit
LDSKWDDPQWFHGRPSATVAPDPKDPAKNVDAPYNAANTTASNLGPTSKTLQDRLMADRKFLEQTQPELVGRGLPADMLTASGSGLDPDITPANAKLQVARVARARGVALEQIDALVEKHLTKRSLWIFGEPRVNVLELNLALEKSFPISNARTMRFNVLAMSGKAVETAGDVQTLILDKTGTITTGDREASDFLPMPGHEPGELIQAAFLASYFDTTPEGRSVVANSASRGARPVPGLDGAKGLEFSAVASRPTRPSRRGYTIGGGGHHPPGKRGCPGWRWGSQGFSKLAEVAEQPASAFRDDHARL